MASSTVEGILNKGITLSYKSEILAGLQSIPDMGGSPEKVEVTTFEDDAKRYIAGLKDYGDLDFKFLYENGENSSFRKLKAAEVAGTIDPYKVAFPDGTTFEFKASVAVKVDSQEPNNAFTFTATLTLNSDIDVTNPSSGN